MATGLKVYNDSGTVQIDENWRNYGFREKISVPITVLGSVGATDIPIFASGAEVLIGCRASQLLPFMKHSYFDAGSWTFNWMFRNLTGSDITETVDFYIFDLMLGSYPDFGLKVFDASGNLVFHSSAPTMKIAGIQGCDAGFTGVPGRSYVPVITRAPYFGVNVGFPAGFRLYHHCLRTSGHVITSSVEPTGPNGASGAYSNPGQYAIINVTGY